MNTEQIMNQPVYVGWIKRHYSALIGLISDIVVFTVDHAGEIAIRALPVVAPLPNAIGMYKTSMDALHFSQWQAFLFAAAIEISIFALAEIAVTMWDSWQAGDVLYKSPFKLMAWVTGAVAILIITLVATLEVYGASGHWILATLPLISVASAVGLCMKRFHKRRQEAKTGADTTLIALNSVRKELENEQAKSDILSERLDEALGLMDALRNEVGELESATIAFRNELEESVKSNQKLSAELEKAQSGLETVRNELEIARNELAEARKPVPAASIDSVLKKLDDNSRAVLCGILEAIESSRVTNPADAAKLTEANKTKVYEMFRLAEVTDTIYKNGDGAYHVR